MNIVFFGYSSMGYHILQYFLQKKETLLGVITHKDDPKENLWFPSVAKLAISYQVPLYFAEDYSKKELRKLVEKLQPQMIFSAYYKNIISKSILQLPSHGAYNFHGSLLPKYRGRCPANWQILEGETESGITIHVMEAKADFGDIVGQQKIPLDPRETAYTLGEKHVTSAVNLLDQILPSLKNGTPALIPQNHSQSTVFGGRKPEDGKIDWQKSIKKIDSLIRAVTHPFPGAFTFFHSKKILIWKASFSMETYKEKKIGEILASTSRGILVATKDGVLEIQELQMEGDPIFSGSSFWRKYFLEPGMAFHNEE